ncbi:type II toxin-antitoxin system PemK/MazF family toxin [Roseospira marina]|uniref:Type II toxin-antitoxin system PemK/MazF family toxin n=1 Tax=Roseospira marina TaxID=140057 RepID=A0A5M6IB44_9PROT|nr:type II toxin-antitoxin system PemK/MazF family toxin [Roseospira marina]KAA5605520.1 type II toxin-antitoxin system PemK/MazF family toxin [Roseospira marina]MBB4314551.1 mRNA interferase MazF [Roseospira marina]MBB5088887.1 mRNA interferase MazF [Roseospira marina]
MPAFEPWDVVKVPYPYTNRPATEHRPALVVARIAEGPGLLWVLMITSAANRAWPCDVPISDLGAAGLPVPSVVRTAKIATIDTALATRLGALPLADRQTVGDMLTGRLPVTDR